MCATIVRPIMYLTGLATAVPPRRFTQAECWAALQGAPRFLELSTRSRALLKRVLSGQNGISTRHLAVEDWESAFVLTPDALHARFAEHAPRLAAQAASRALEAARLAPAEMAIDPLAKYSSGLLAWDRAQHLVATDCNRRFARRLRWAGWLQQGLFQPVVRSSLLRPAARSKLIWQGFFKLLR